jgi:hypothetical protein
METDDLIARLAGENRAVAPGTVGRILFIGVGAGAFLSFALMKTWLGMRPDLSVAMDTGAYWVKFFYTALLALIAFRLTERLGRPGTNAERPMRLLVLPVLGLVVLGVVQLSVAQASTRMHLVMGGSAQVCPWRIVILALPIFAGTFLSMRQLAPTRPVVAGAAAGLLAGALGAWVYAFHCDESAMPFVALWYTLGMAAVGALGAAAGRLLLRW